MWKQSIRFSYMELELYKAMPKNNWCEWCRAEALRRTKLGYVARTKVHIDEDLEFITVELFSR